MRSRRVPHPRRTRRSIPRHRRPDPPHANPFPVYDREIRRLRAYLAGLTDADWKRRSHCPGWSVKDVVAHLSTDEVYNQAGLDHTLDQLPSSGGLTDWNARGVRIRGSLSPLEARQEWEARQERVRRAWSRIGVDGRIETSVGRYPLRLQAWHLAREYAIHSDDIEVPISPAERGRQLAWRAAFGLYAAREEGDPVDATIDRDTVILRIGGRSERLDLESFIAYLTGRPQQLREPAQRRLVRRLLER